jgi:hypothetical protein
MHDIIHFAPFFLRHKVNSGDMAEDQTRITVRLPDDSVEQLRSELPHFNTDAARFQFLVQFYFDFKESDAINMMLCCDGCCEKGTGPKDCQPETSTCHQSEEDGS